MKSKVARKGVDERVVMAEWAVGESAALMAAMEVVLEHAPSAVRCTEGPRHDTQRSTYA